MSIKKYIVQEGGSAHMKKYEEIITINGRNISVARTDSPTNVDYTAGDLKLLTYDINDSQLKPGNFDKPGGTPMTLLRADNLKVDLSKRTKEPMDFWHRSCDFHEFDLLFQGFHTMGD